MVIYFSLLAGFNLKSWLGNGGKLLLRNLIPISLSGRSNVFNIDNESAVKDFERQFPSLG